MLRLHEQHCEVCEQGAPPVSDEDLATFKPQIPEWEVITEDGTRKLCRTYAFDDFMTALGFTVEIGETAEEEGHHPTLITEWGKTTVIWWTHKIDDLHINDLIMAARSDEVYKEHTP